MHSRRIACLLLGFWLAGGVFMAFVATENFRSVDRLLDQANPVARLQFKSLGPANARMLMRYAAAEQNRYLFETWEIAQVILGILFFFFLLFGTREDKFSLLMALILLVIALGQRLVLTPEIVALGRTIDFIPPEVQSGARTKFLLLHRGYEAVELVKWAVEFGLATRLILARRRERSGSDIRQELDLINKANYRHIDR